jgi:hypothetical protein
MPCAMGDACTHPDCVDERDLAAEAKMQKTIAGGGPDDPPRPERAVMLYDGVTYAADTSVSVEKSRAEIDALLQKHGAEQRIVGSDDRAGLALVLFTIAQRQVRLQVPLPKLEDFPRRNEQPRGWYSWSEGRRGDWRRKAFEQACRSRWRAVALLIKAKLEAIQIGISTPEREFLADIALPDGRTIHSALKAGLAEAYEGGKMPPLLGIGDPP